VQHREYRTQIARKIAESVNVDEFKRLLSESVGTDEQEKCLVDYVIKLAPFVDFGMIEFDEIDEFSPSIIWETFEAETVVKEFVNVRLVHPLGDDEFIGAVQVFGGQSSENDNGTYKIERDIYKVLIKNGYQDKIIIEGNEQTAPAESPDDIVAIGGESLENMKILAFRVKEYAKNYSSGIYKWDGKNCVYNVQRATFNALVRDNFFTLRNLQSATIKKW